MAKPGRTPYEVLGVARDATPEEIRRAYRLQARRYHPDLNADRDSRVRFEELASAYEVLHDPGSRARYDRSRPAAPRVDAPTRSPRRPTFSAAPRRRDVPRFLDDDLPGAHRAVFRVQVTVRMPFRFRWPPW